MLADFWDRKSRTEVRGFIYPEENLECEIFDKNIYLALIGGLIIFISGVRIDFLIYQKDRDPDEIAKKIKELVKKG